MAELVGVTEAAISQVLSGDLALSSRLASKMAVHLGERVTPRRLMSLSQKQVLLKNATKALVAVKSADNPVELLQVAAKAEYIANAPGATAEVVRQASEVATEAAKAIVKSATQDLAKGVTGSWSTPAGSTLDPNLDPQHLRVASDGSGNFYVFDVVAGTVVLTFGNVVQQQGTPAGSKSATKSSTQSKPGRNVAGHRLRG